MCIYGLSFYFRKILRKKDFLLLPNVVQKTTLPIVFSRNECKRIFSVVKNLKHRVSLTLMYSAGLRVGELCSLKIWDIDFDRMTITVRQGKGNKDRCIPLSVLQKKGLIQYYNEYGPNGFVFFSGKDKSTAYSPRSVQHILSKAMEAASILKKGASPHTLRHTFATHLLENGTNIVRIQQLMGHTDIKSTLIYTRLVNADYGMVVSPLDSLYQV